MSSGGAFDVVILGGGPGGYATALRAAGHGLRVAVVEADRLGGTCLHRGCVPSKALLHIAHLADAVPALVELGLATPGPALDIRAAGRFRDGIVDQLHRGLRGLVKAHAAEIVHGWGRVVAPGKVDVDVDGDRRRLEAAHVVVAVGSTAIDLPGVAPDGERVLRSDDALRLDRVPGSAVVVGGGAVGVEIASLWRSLGASVTVVEAADRLLPGEDPDACAALARAFTRRGIDVRTGTAVVDVDGDGDHVAVRLSGEGDGRVQADQLLVAVGRRPATAGCGLDALGVLDDRGHVRVDALGRTPVAGLWAVGDAVPSLALAHAAFAEGFAAADAIAGLEPEPVDHRLVPRVTYCRPEVASVGLTEPEARDLHGDVRVTTVTLAGNARALIEGEGGLLKLVTDAEGTLLGAHVVGPSATELIGELGLATTWNALASEVGQVAHAHPTLSESVREAALAAAGLPFHVHV